MALQPGHRIRVEVISRFVKQENIWLHQEQATQGHPPFFTARQRRNHRIGSRATQRVEGHLDTGVEVPATTGIEDRLNFSLASQDLLLLLDIIGLGDLHKSVIILFE